MSSSAKSSFTLSPHEVSIILTLKQRLGAKSNVDVIRRALRLLDESSARDVLRREYRQASDALRAVTRLELGELDHLSQEGLGE